MKFILSALVSVSALVATVDAHSWMQCTKWVFNNQAAFTNASLRRYGDADGYCDGFPRNYPIGYKINGVPAIFGLEDGAFGMPGYFQNSLDTQSCATSAQFPPQDQSYKADPSSQYAPSTYAGYNLGKMATYTAGETVCIRWPAKNHFDNIPVGPEVKEVFMYMRKADTADPATQRAVVAQSMVVANFWFRQCPVAGVPTAGDQNGPGSNTRPCGDCFTVPANLTAGRYFLQWYWSRYTTCSDVMVRAATGASTSPPPSTSIKASASVTPSPSKSPLVSPSKSISASPTKSIVASPSTSNGASLAPSPTAPSSAITPNPSGGSVEASVYPSSAASVATSPLAEASPESVSDPDASSSPTPRSSTTTSLNSEKSSATRSLGNCVYLMMALMGLLIL